MAKYELTFLLSEEAESKKIKELLESLAVKIAAEENWGQKTLAYPVKKNHTAYFYNWTLDVDKAKVTELKRRLNFHEKLLRYLLLTK